MANQISDIFFDLDHTLWDFDKNSALAFEVIFKKHEIKVDVDAFLISYVPINLKYWELYRVDKITHDELRFGRIREVFDEIAYEIDDAKVEIIATEYIEHLPENNHLFDGAFEVLDYLKSKYKLHIITNGFAKAQQKKLKNSKIDHYFQTITDSEIAGCKKPNSQIYEFALELAKAKKESSIMIGDCLISDVMGALDSGMDAILFSAEIQNVSEDIKQVNHLLDLKKYL